MPRELDERLNDLIDGRLPADEARALHARLTQEPALQERHDELHRIGALLRAADPARDTQVPTGFASQIRARTQAAAAGAASDSEAVDDPAAGRLGERPRGRMFRFFAVAYAAAAVLVLGVTLVVTLRDDSAPQERALADRKVEERERVTEPDALAPARTLDKKSAAFGSERPSKEVPFGARGGGAGPAAAPTRQPEPEAKSEPGTLEGAPADRGSRRARGGSKKTAPPTGGRFGPGGEVRPGLRKPTDGTSAGPTGAPAPKPTDTRTADDETPRGPPAAPIVPEASGADAHPADGLGEQREVSTSRTFVLSTTDVDATVRSLKQHLATHALGEKGRKRATPAAQPEPDAAPGLAGKPKKSHKDAQGSAGAFERLERELARDKARFGQAKSAPAAKEKSKRARVVIDVDVTPAQLARLLALVRATERGRWAKQDTDSSDNPDDRGERPPAPATAAGPTSPATPAMPKAGGGKPAERRIRIRIVVQAR